MARSSSPQPASAPPSLSSSQQQRHQQSISKEPPAAPRPRVCSRDIPRSYSGLYGEGGGGDDRRASSGNSDLLPFELARNQNTDWLEQGGWPLLCLFVGAILCVQFVAMAMLDDIRLSWTITHTVHLVVTIIFVHWLKGSPLDDDQGEMNALTLWEQLEGSINGWRVRRVLLIIPTLLCYAACHFAQYEPRVSGFNILIWSVSILAKLPFMNGVRILGINRTTGIDDEYSYRFSAKYNRLSKKA